MNITSNLHCLTILHKQSDTENVIYFILNSLVFQLRCAFSYKSENGMELDMLRNGHQMQNFSKSNRNQEWKLICFYVVALKPMASVAPIIVAFFVFDDWFHLSIYWNLPNQIFYSRAWVEFVQFMNFLENEFHTKFWPKLKTMLRDNT